MATSKFLQANLIKFPVYQRTRNMESPSAYIPIDRRLALTEGQTLPDRMHGVVLFADISGFTLLTDALLHALGSRRGTDELTRQLNQVYDALTQEVYAYQG